MLILPNKAQKLPIIVAKNNPKKFRITKSFVLIFNTLEKGNLNLGR